MPKLVRLIRRNKRHDLCLCDKSGKERIQKKPSAYLQNKFAIGMIRQTLDDAKLPRNESQSCTHPLVRSVGAVELAIAAPFCRYAVLFRALELLDGITFRGRTFRLVGSITAVVIAIAHPSALNAASVVTGELIRAASVVCEKSRKLKMCFEAARKYRQSRVFSVERVFN